MAHDPLRRRGFAFLDLLLTLALLALVAATTMPAMVSAWEAANRVKCGTNLRRIGQTMRQYAIDDVRGGAYPRTLYDATAGDKPQFATPYGDDAKPGPKVDADPFATAELAKRKPELESLVPFTPAANDVTAAMWHLLRLSDLTTGVFNCPSTLHKPVVFAPGKGKTAYTNWPGKAALRDGLSYSFQQMYPNNAAVGRGFKWTDSLNSAFVLAGDMNPGTDEALALTVGDLPDKDAGGMMFPGTPYNSFNHFGTGQNLLYADGSVRFTSTPMAGPRRDNVFAYRDAFVEPAGEAGLGNIKSAGFAGSPFDSNDNVLLPTAKQLGQTARPMPSDEDVLAEVEAQRKLDLERQRAGLMRNGERAMRQTEDFVRNMNSTVQVLPAQFAQEARGMDERAAIMDELSSAARAKGDTATAARAAAAAGEARAAADRLRAAADALDGATSRPAK